MTLLVGSIFHMTRKIVSEMTYNVSMGTLNPTIPIPIQLTDKKKPSNLIHQERHLFRLLILRRRIWQHTRYRLGPINHIHRVNLYSRMTKISNVSQHTSLKTKLYWLNCRVMWQSSWALMQQTKITLLHSLTHLIFLSFDYTNSRFTHLLTNLISYNISLQHKQQKLCLPFEPEILVLQQLWEFCYIQSIQHPNSQHLPS